MKGTFKKVIALIMTVALVATTITFTAGNTLKAEENPGESTATEQKAEPAPAPAPDKSEPATEKQEVVVESDNGDSSAEGAEEVALTEEEAIEEEEEAMPAQSFSQTASNGITVNVSAPEGAFPEGTTMKVSAVSHERAMDLVDGAVADVSDANGVDITFYKDGKEIQPEKNISVKLGNVRVDGDDFSVYHVEDNGSVEKVTDNATSNGATFKADEFSVYIVIGQDEEIEVRDALQLNVRFVNNANVDIHDRDTKFIEETDEQGNYTVSYTLPTIEGKTPESVEGEGATFKLSDDKTKITATVAPLEKDEDSDEVVQQTVSCVVKYTSGNANYKVEHWFEKADATADTPADQRYEKNAKMDTSLSGEIETETAATANSVEGYTPQEINQEYIKADGSTVVKVYYDCNEYFLTYNTMGGSYIKGKDIKHGGDVDIVSVEEQTREKTERICGKEEHKSHTDSCYTTKTEKVLTCGEEAHSHSSYGIRLASNHHNETYGCYTSQKSGGSWKWVLTCGKDEHSHKNGCYTNKTTKELTCTKPLHTHTDSCYKTVTEVVGRTSSPTPVKEGYKFAGWYLDEGCTKAAPDSMENVKSDIEVYAKWVPGDSKYTIVYYTENADNDGYTFDSTGTGTAKTGSKVSGTQKTIDGFTYNAAASDQNVTVKANGSTVVKMYYSRNTYTFTFKDGSTTVHSFTAKWGSNISDKWAFKGSNGTNYPKSNTVTSWTPSGSKTYTERITGLEIMPKENITWTHTTSKNTKRTFYYYVEAQGNGTKSYDGKKFNLYKTVEHDFNYTTYNEDFLVLDGYDRYKITTASSATGSESNQSASAGSEWSTKTVTNFYYTLKSYKITKMNDGNSSDETYKYGQDITGANTAPAKPAGKEDYTFGGWYEDPDCAGTSYNFKTMPANNIILYAKWVKPDKTVTAVLQNGEPDVKKTVGKGDKVTLDTPTRAGYNFDGWYTAANGGEEFDINAPITDNVTVYAHWTAKSKVQYTVKFETTDGKTVAESHIDQGRVGSKVKANAVAASGDYAGYYPDAAVKTITLDQDANNNVITFKYSDKSDFDYRIIYKYNNKTIQTGEVVTVHQNETRVVATDIPDGYQIAGEQYKTVHLGFDKVTDVVFQLEPKQYSITYEDTGNANWKGEDGCEHPSTYTCDQLVGNNITIDGVERDGSIFLGWDFTATNADGTPARVVGEHNNANPVISEGTYGDLVFKAIWGKVVADDVEKTYDGQPLGIGTPQVDVPSYCKVGKIQYSKTGNEGDWQDTAPTWTDAGTYTTYIKVTINGYRNLKTTAKVTINKRNVTLESATDSKAYDGKALTNKNVTVSGDGFAGTEGADYNVTGTQTAKGESANTFTYTLKDGAKEGNYNITKKEGKLTVTGQKDVVVTIKERGGEYTYDGSTKTVTGYDIVSISNPSYTSKDFTFDGNASVSGKDAGTYEMQLKPENFHNSNNNYDSVTFVVQDAQLVIKPITDKIIITAASNSSKKYDGKPLTDSKYTYTPNILRDGDVLTAVVEGSQTDAGTSANKVVSWQVKRGDEDVTHNYTFRTPKDGTLEVLKRDVTLTSDSSSKVYDGKYLSKETVTVSGDGFIEGEGATYSDFASTMKIGSIANTYKYALNENTKAGNYNITKKNGTLTILSKETPIVIKANSNSKTYDGTALTDPGYTYTQGILAEGDVLKVTVSGSIKNAGTKPNTVTSYKVMRGEEDVTDCYNFATPVAGTLTVNKRSVEFTSATDSKTYDGKPLTNHDVTVGGDGFANGEGADFDVTGTITKAGSTANAFTYTLKDGAKAENYDITKTEGTLTVSKKNDVVVTITEHSGEYTYDGTEKTVTGYDVSISNDLYTEADFTFNGKAEVKGTDVGEYNMQLKASDFTNNNDDFESVTFNIVDGKMTIKKVETPITVTANSNSKTYDGTALQDKGYTYTENVLAAGDKLTAVVSGSIKDAGDQENKVVSYKVMRGDKDVTEFYTFSDSVSGKLTVLPKAITIKSKDAEKEYDGTALTKNELTETPAFAPGDTATFNYTGSQTEVGNSQNTFTCTLAKGVDPDNYTISLEYGTLKVTRVTEPIVITAASQEKTYDGQPLTNGGFTYTQGVLKSGDVLTAEVSGEITDVGTASNVVTSYKVMRGNQDVTKCYTFGESVNGSLEVSKRNVRLTSASASKDYDGSALTDETITVTGDGFVKGQGLFAKDEGADFTVTGSQKIAGTSRNTFTYVLNDNTKAGNYNITKVEGDLTVNPIGTPITVTAQSESKTYDGKALKNDKFSYTEGVLLEGDTLTAVVNGTQTNVGKSDNVVESYKVMRGKTDVTGCYSFTDSVNGTLEVTKRNVTLTSASDSKTYDGEALTNDTVTVTGDGFIEGEGYTAEFTGSQTEVGSSANAFEYSLNEGTNEGNYNITKEEGTLAVSELGGVIVQIKENSGSKVYNGSEQKIEGYEVVSISDPKYKESDITFNGTAVAKGTDVGTYDMELTPEDFGNKNKNFKDVEFQIIDGQLTITQVEAVLQVKAGSASKMYDGTALTCSDWTCENQDALAKGDELKVKTEGTITNYGDAVNTIKSYKVMRNGTDVTANYKFADPVDGALAITKRNVSLTSADDHWTYDGSAHNNNAVTAEGDGFVGEEGATYSNFPSITEVGTVANSFDYTLKGNTNAANYNITKTAGTLEIKPAENVIVHITGNVDTVTYNGSEQSVTGYTWTATSNLVKEGDFTFNGNAIASGVDAGSYNMNLKPEMFSSSTNKFKSITFQVVRDGQLTINPISTEIAIKAKSGSKMYDGSALTAGYEYNESALVNGDVLTAEVSGSQTNVGKSANTVTSYVVKRGEKDVTSNYKFKTPEKGELTVTKRNVTLTSATDSKTYDGTELKNNKITVSGDGFVEGEGFTKKVTGTITNVGNVANAFTYSLKDGTLAGNYDITKAEGTLTITPVNTKLVITAGSAGKKYDGTALTCDTITYTENVLAKGDTVQATVSGSQTAAGSSANTIAGYKIMHGTTDVTKNYSNITTEDGTLSVSKRNVTITSASQTWEYDGDAHSNNEATVGGDGFVEGEADNARGTGTITELGTETNTIEYDIHNGFNANNYNITETPGSLNVIEDANEVVVTITGHKGSYEYDGKAKTVEGYEVTISKPSYKASYIKFNGKDKITKTDAGTYEMGLTADDFVNTNKGFKNVRFVVTDGELEITPVSTKIVITAESASKMYDGTALENDGFTYTEGVLVNGDRLTAVVEGSQTNFGSSANVVSSYAVTRDGKDVTGNYSFGESVDGTLTVSKRAVTLTSASKEWTYDKNEHSEQVVTASGDGWADGEGAEYNVTGTIKNVGDETNTFTYTLNDGTLADNYTITKREGNLKVKPVAEKVTVTVTGKRGTAVYNGSEQEVTGYDFVSDSDMYTAADFSFTGTARATGLDVGTYNMSMKASDFTNTNTNFTNVEFVIENGALEITPIEKEIVVKAKSDTKEYDGTALTNSGFTFTDDVLIGDDTLTAVVSGSITNAGTEINKVDSYKVMRGKTDVTANYTFGESVNGTLTVTKRPVTVKSQNGEKTYDGTALKKEAFDIVAGCLVSGETFVGSAYAERTAVGRADNTFTVSAGANTSLDNYEITQQNGELNVTKKGDVVVTITGNSDTVTYNGSKQSVSGYTWSASCNTEDKELYKESDFTFNGTAVVKGTDAGNYTMNLKASDFANVNPNFENVKFVINDGRLTIDPISEEIEVIIREHSDTKAYNGSLQSVTGYDVVIPEDSLYTRADFSKPKQDSAKATASGTIAGEYPMGLEASDFSNTSKNFTNVKFTIVDGKLTITPADVSIEIKAASESRKYNGQPLTNDGWNYTEKSGSLIDGDVIDVSVTGIVTNAGKADNVPTVLIKRNGVDVTDSYKSVKGIKGELEVTKRDVTLTSATVSKTYDGTALENKTVTVGGDGFVGNECASYSGFMSITDPGNIKNVFNYELSGGAVAGNYNVTKAEGTLTVHKINTPITIKADSASKPYDGTELTKGTYTYTENVLVPGDVLTATVEGSIKNAGTTSNNVTSYKVMRGTTDVTDNYTFAASEPGELKVTKRNVVLTSATDGWTYDGATHSAERVTVSGDGFAGNEGADYSDFASIKKAGTVDNSFSYSLKSGTDADNYQISTVKGKLSVAKKNQVIVNITGHTDSKPYNGTTQSVTGYDVSITDPLYSEACFKFKGDATASGLDADTYAMGLKSSDFENTDDNFDNVTFLVQDGSLEITPVSTPIVVTAATQTRMYNGEALANGNFTYNNNLLKNGDVLEAVVEGTITDVGSVSNKVTGVKVTRNGEDVSKNYRFGENVNGTLTVTKRDVTLTSEGGSKVYDGQALTNATITETGNGFIEGEGYEAEITGTQTTVGTSDNEFTYELKGNTKAGNYNIATAFGLLEVTPVTDKVTVTITENSGKAVYDGTVKTVTGYEFDASNKLYKKDYVDFTGTASVSGTLAGTYEMELSADDFRNNSSNFSNVEFQIVDGNLQISPITKELKITAATDSKVYDGKALENAGYTYTENVLVNGDVLTAVVKGTVTDVDKVDNKVFDYKVTRGEEDVTKCYTGIKTVKGELTVTPRPITIKSESAARAYNKKALTAESVSVTGGLGFADGEAFECSNFASITNVGSTPNTYDYAAAAGTKLSNYDITAEKGQLTVTKKGDVIVTITGHNNADGDAYDRKAHTVEGYDVSIEGSEDYTTADFTFTGNDKASRTDAGTTSMGLTAADFTNNDEGFDVTFVVKDGYVKVNPITDETVVTITEHSKTDAVYNGQTQTVSGYDISIPEGSLYSEDDFDKIAQNDKHATVSGMLAATYDMELSEKDFTNKNKNFTNVVFNIVDGQLVIAPISDAITVTAKNGSKIYDGSALTNDGFRLEGTLANGDILTAVVEGSQTDVGTADNKVISYTIKHGNIDVTDSYSGVTTVNGTLEITKRTVTLTSADASKEYDGTALTAKTVTPAGFVEGQGATFDVTGSQTDVGESDNTFAYTLNSGTKAGNYDITVVPGTLKVKKNTKEIVVSADSDSMMYNGSALTNAGFTYTDGVLAQGESLTATVEGSRTKVGTSDNVVTSYRVMRGNTDVTDFYTFGDSVDGSLTVTKRNVTLTSATDSKTYDGTALENHGVTVSGDGFVAGEGATYDVTGSQLNQGSSENVFKYSLNEGTDAGNYNITTKNGTLTVSKKGQVVVTITEHSGEFTYDATEKTVNGYDVSISDPLYTTDDFTFSGNAVVKGTRAGTYDMELSEEDFTNDNENFDNVRFVIVDGQLTIKKKTITIQIKGDNESRAYNGEELTGGSTVYGETPVRGEIVVTTEGGLTDVGEVANKITDVKIMDGDKDLTDNYVIKAEISDGKLEVTPRKASIKTSSDAKAYDGTALTKKNDVTVEGFVEGEGADVEVTGKITDAGTVANTFKYTLKDGTKAANYDITTTEGTLTVNKRAVTLKSKDGSWAYDGKKHSPENNDVVISGDGFVKGEVDNIRATGEITDVGTEENTIKYDTLDGFKEKNYEITLVPGTLTVTKKSNKIIITAASDSKKYDGKVLTNGGYTYTEGVLAEGDVLVANVEGARKNAGISENVITGYSIMRGDKVINGNYDVETVSGTLEVTPRNITVTSASDNKKYDGKPLTANSFTIEGDGMAENEEFIVLFGEGQTAVGEKDNDFEILGIADVEEEASLTGLTINDVSVPRLDNYNINIVFGKLKVEKAPVADGGGSTFNRTGLVAGNGYDLTVLGNENTPLASGLLDAHCCILHLLLMLAALLMLLWYTSDMKKRQRRIFELEDRLNKK
ncbi:MAG: InlB B-repeat-containing protein [Bacillota bacterium]|nr:InlB B-repeat-containing protein [Bacillota bacterium]